ncbi:TetR/AcrR family transcriptional regulator [Rhizobium wenxiniae]|uniref:TetR/AcrR family transcriptional regulator n=1 Tax=Rhizobium wenxiniae TaxID=1737357 RepID=UPI001C6F4527|nr:TetR/AcrR family transcriptional regulator [Rhizobium wenxiniae]MBW9089769.1 TetR/AcrR family transcriptional regulator [Rhizobium wenxiniae]
MVTIASRLPRLSKESRTENIIDVAVQLYVRDGYGQTSMSSIAAAVGGSKATLYKYFPSREALFETAMVQCCDALFAELPTHVPSRTSILDYLNRVGQIVLEAMLKPRALDLARLVFSEGARHPEIAQIFYSKGVEPTHALIADGLAYFHSLGQIVSPDPFKSARYFLGMLRGDVHLRAVCGLEPFPGNASLVEHVAQAATLFLIGMAPPTQRDLGNRSWKAR